MARKRQPGTEQPTHARQPTPTFLLELPLQVTSSQAKRLRAHLEAARQLYTAILSEGQRRLRRMRADPAWQAARTIARAQKLERQRAFAALRAQYGFSEYALHDAAKGLNGAQDPRPPRRGARPDPGDARLSRPEPGCVWDTLAGCGACSRGRSLSRVENKRPDTGLRFELQQPEEGNAGYLLWQGDRLPAIIDWEDPVVTYGLAHRVKDARLIVRQASSPKAQGADREGQRSCVQLARSGVPSQKPKHPVGHDRVGLDLGPSTLAIVPREGTPRLEGLCAERAPDAQAIRRLQRQMERQRRANTPDHYDAQGRIKKPRKGRLSWKHSKQYLATRRGKATRERRLAAHRKSLHGRLVHEIVAVGNTVITEQLSYRARPQQ